MAQGNTNVQAECMDTSEEGDDQRIFQLDPPTLDRITKEIDQMSNVKPDDLDEPSFQRYVARQLREISCVFGQANVASESSAVSVPSTSENNDATSYNFNHLKRGLAVLISNEYFTKNPKDNRHSSSHDAKYLYHTLHNLGFEVMLLKDLSAKKMVEALKLAAKMYNHGKADCFVCAVMTHGHEKVTDKVRQDLLLGTDGEGVQTKVLVDLFSDTNCPGLKGKPRLFFLQACRGNKFDPGQKVFVYEHNPSAQQSTQPASTHDKLDTYPLTRKEYPLEDHQGDAHSTDVMLMGKETQGGADEGSAGCDKTDAKPVKPIQDVPINPEPVQKDFLIMYATPPGYYAWRRTNGSWFMQSLCQVLCSKSVPKTSLLTLLTQVTNVTTKYVTSEGNKECPVTVNMLVKDIYLSKKNPGQT